MATSDGTFIAYYSSNGLCGMRFPCDADPTSTDSSDTPPAQVLRWHQVVTQALRHALAGKECGPLPPLDLSSGTDFQKQVWQAMCQICLGRTSNYGEIAQAIGNPKALRAVGQACGANPIPVFVPCHRVLAAHNALGGFSAGLKWKRLLLAREGVLLELGNDA